MNGIASSDRRLMPDLIRAWAIIGIVLVNVEIFAFDMIEGYGAGGLVTNADHAAHLAIVSLFLAKSYSLFSLMFGAGLAFQMQSAERRGKAFAPRYWRRIVGLLVLGLLHAIFFFIGDILVLYATLGAVLFFVRNGDPRNLWIGGIVLIVVQALLFLAFAVLFDFLRTLDPEIYATKLSASMAPMADYAEIMASGSFLDVASYRAGLLPFLYQSLPLMQGISTLGFFLIGLALVKQGALSDPDAQIWRLGRWIGLPVGLVGSAYGAYLMHQAPDRVGPEMMMSMAAIFAAAPFSTFGYAGWIAKACEGAAGPVRRFLARGGSATLTAYLFQSIILSFLFAGYGLGLSRRSVRPDALPSPSALEC